MPNYDFLNLSPPEFEDLSRDLLQQHFKVVIESFTAGKIRELTCVMRLRLKEDL